MISKIQSPHPGYVRIRFELPPFLWADQVAVVGDFNDWSPTATPLRQDREGVWQAQVDLPLGSRCEFRYLVDGAWMTDYHADGFAPNRYGSNNSVIMAILPQDVMIIRRRPSLVHNGAAGDLSSISVPRGR
jgi:hypothetical protein